MKYLFANWKNTLSVDQSVELAKHLSEMEIPDQVVLGVFPSTLALTAVVDLKPGFMVGAQDGHAGDHSHTGEIDMKEIAAAGASLVIVGHSEKRYNNGETNEVVKEKLDAAVIEAGLVPVLCVGEREEDQDATGMGQLLFEQLSSALSYITAEKLFIAYEPVWAVGSGKNAPVSRVHDALEECRKIVEANGYKGEVIYLYGGSVKAENVASYVTIEGLGGFLVGGASTKLSSLKALIKAL